MNDFVEWITAKELMQRWNINAFALYQAFSLGLHTWNYDIDVLKELKNELNEQDPSFSDFHKRMADMIENAHDLEKNLLLAVAQNDLREATRLISNYKFSIEEVEQFEKEHGIIPFDPNTTELSGKERSELGRLRKEKEKWDESIKAAVKITINCVKMNKALTKDQLWDEFAKEEFDIPYTTMEKVRAALPKKYKKGAGAPKK